MGKEITNFPTRRSGEIKLRYKNRLEPA